MSDVDTKIPELLRDLATEMPADPGVDRRVLGRARRRRVLTASGTLLAVAALVVGGVFGIGALRAPSTGVTPLRTPEPSPPPVEALGPAFEGIWPETSAAELETAQAQVDQGHQPWQLDPGQTAVAFATNLLGWSYDATSSSIVQLADDRATVRISNAAFGPRVPPITVVLRQLGRGGPSGIWTVVKGGSPILDVQVRPYPLRAGADATVTGHLTEAFDASTVRVDLLAGPTLESRIVGGVRPLEPGFDWTGALPSGSLGDVTVLVRNVDATGMALAASAFAVPLVDPSSSPVPTNTATPTDVASAKVEQTRDVILAAARSRDYQALASLLSPGFSYDFYAVADPIADWKADPTTLDMLAGILEMPPALLPGTGPDGDLYVWPYLARSNLTDLSQQERADLTSLGISDKDVASMIRGFGAHGYVGPRTVIGADGTWLSFTIGGD